LYVGESEVGFFLRESEVTINILSRPFRSGCVTSSDPLGVESGLIQKRNKKKNNVTIVT
jgi:hypothetical protein